MEEGINTRLKKIEETLKEEKEVKPKKSKLTRKFKMSGFRKKGNWITIMKINENKSVDIKKEPIINQTVMIDGIPRLATGEHVLSYGKENVMILPSWNVEPFSPSKNLQESIINGSNAKGYSLLLSRMKEGHISAKKQVGWGIGIGVLIIIGVLAYGLFAG
jgi:hypothetical protein